MNKINVDICIATYNRPDLLINLLDSLDKQKNEALCMRVIIVDNDIERGAERAVEKFRATHSLNVLYDVEPTQGISNARNKTLKHVNADYAAFLDDDEFVSDQWLEKMWTVLHRFEADVVFGPVKAMLPIEAPSWARLHPAFSSPIKKTGEPVSIGATGNVMFRVDALGVPMMQFDTSFALTGGEDTDFFHRLKIAGKSFVWCNEGEVYEVVPPERATIKWVLRRAYRGGQSFYRIFIKQKTYLENSFWLIKKTTQLLIGVLPLLFYPLLPSSWAVKILCKVASATGQLSGLLGMKFWYREYGKETIRSRN